MREHIADVFMGGENGGPLPIVRTEEQAKLVGDLRCRFVLAVIGFYADDRNEAWPAAQTIADHLNTSERQVRTCLEVLEMNEYIHAVRIPVPGKMGTTFRFTTPRFRDIEIPKTRSSRSAKSQPVEGSMTSRSPARTQPRDKSWTQSSMDSRMEGRMDSRMLACAKKELEYNQERMVSGQKSLLLVRVRDLLNAFGYSLATEHHSLIEELDSRMGPEPLLVRLKLDLEDALAQNREFEFLNWLEIQTGLDETL